MADLIDQLGLLSERLLERLADGLPDQEAVGNGEVGARRNGVPVAFIERAVRLEVDRFGSAAHVHPSLLQVLLALVNVVGCQPVPESPRAGMNHHPEVILLVVLQLAEVVPASQAAELPDSALERRLRDVPRVADRDEVALRVLAMEARAPAPRRTTSLNLA